MFYKLSFILYFLFVAATGDKLPPEFDLCPKGAAFDTCLAGRFKVNMGFVQKGHPSMGILPLSPIKFSVNDIPKGNDLVSVNVNFKELSVKGLDNVDFSNFKSDFENAKYTGDVFFKKIELQGTYNIDGKIWVLPIAGDGQSDVILEDVSGSFVTIAPKHEKNGDFYLRVEKFDLILNPAKTTIRLRNLFNGDKAMGDALNKYFNENSSTFLTELKPIIQEAVGSGFITAANKAIGNVPLQELFQE